MRQARPRIQRGCPVMGDTVHPRIEAGKLRGPPGQPDRALTAKFPVDSDSTLNPTRTRTLLGSASILVRENIAKVPSRRTNAEGIVETSRPWRCLCGHDGVSALDAPTVEN